LIRDSALPTFIISKVREGKKPYKVLVVHDLPTEPIAFHAFMRDNVCRRHGWGVYVVSRSHSNAEKRGFKGVWLGAVQPEGVTTLKSYSHNVTFPGEPHKRMWFERGDLRKFIRIPQFDDSYTRVLKSMLGLREFGVPKPKTAKVKKGIQGLIEACLKECSPQRE